VDTARQVVLDDLARPPGRIRRRLSRGGSGEPVVEVTEGGHAFQADLATVRFVKERAVERRRLYYVTFEGFPFRSAAHAPTRFGWVFEVKEDAHGWRMASGFGETGDEPPRHELRVNLGGGGSPGQFCAGGRVLATGLDIAWVRLVCANGLVLDDDTEGGVVLFITEQRAEAPVTAELYDRAGTHVASHEVLPG